uniref:Uncharacterized protein n=1 Tax=Trichuris muris TaxID=70415 RepID=A0A5S6QGC9_TRIMR
MATAIAEKKYGVARGLIPLRVVVQRNKSNVRPVMDFRELNGYIVVRPVVWTNCRLPRTASAEHVVQPMGAADIWRGANICTRDGSVRHLGPAADTMCAQDADQVPCARKMRITLTTIYTDVFLEESAVVECVLFVVLIVALMSCDFADWLSVFTGARSGNVDDDVVPAKLKRLSRKTAHSARARHVLVPAVFDHT